jgi:hypothetical protein
MRQKVVCWGVVFWVLAAYLAWGFLGGCPKACARVLTLMTTGTTIILEGNLARARNVAIANGKRNALEVAVKSLVAESVAFDNYEMINDHIYQHHERFIDTFRILSENSRNTVYEVTLESTVAVGKLKTTLVNLGLIEDYQGREPSRFQLRVSEVSCAGCLESLSEYIQRELEGVDDVSLYSIRPGEFTLNILYRGDIGNFQEALLAKRFDNFRLDQAEASQADLQVVMVVTESEDD